MLKYLFVTSDEDLTVHKGEGASVGGGKGGLKMEVKMSLIARTRT